MANYNHFVLVGHLTRDPELKQIPSGTEVASGGIAYSEKYKNNDGDLQERVSFFDFDVWGKRARVFCEYVKKGDAVLLEGKMQQDRWESEDGTKRSRVKLSVMNFQFLPRREEKGDEDGQW